MVSIGFTVLPTPCHDHHFTLKDTLASASEMRSQREIGLIPYRTNNFNETVENQQKSRSSVNFSRVPLRSLTNTSLAAYCLMSVLLNTKTL